MFESIVEAVFRHAAQHPDRLCLADDDSRISYGEYAERIQRYAAAFSSEGIAPGDRVVVEACQRIDYLAIGLALQLNGAVSVPVEHNCAPNKIQSFIARAEATAVITSREIAFESCRHYSYEQMFRLCESAQSRPPRRFPQREAVCEILFSTGTTGREKGIVITHANNLALAENVICGVEMEADNIEMIPSPMNHSHGLRRYYANMVNGSAVILLGSAMNMKRFMYNMDAYGVNSIDLVPSALSVVLRLSKGKLADYSDRLRYIQFGAAPMMESDRDEICRLLPHTRLYNFYGSTESGCIAIYNFNRPDAKKNCVGKPTRNADIFIVDDDRRAIVSSVDHSGLLASRGGMNTCGYWRDAAETNRVLADGALYSNDVAYFDGDGDIILLGRKGDVINVGGNKVSPEEIENAAMAIPGVQDCGVIPVDDPFKGSVPKLFVQMEGGRAFDPVRIRALLTAALEPYKVPVCIEQIDRIPRSYNGKLLRRDLMAEQK